MIRNKFDFPHYFLAFRQVIIYLFDTGSNNSKENNPNENSLLFFINYYYFPLLLVITFPYFIIITCKSKTRDPVYYIHKRELMI